MSDTPVDLREALEELSNYASDVQQATYQTATNAIQRYVARLDSHPIDSIARTVFPPVDFDAWYAEALKTMGSIIGSGRLDWPVDNKRITLWAELLRRIARGKIRITDHIASFHYYERGCVHSGVEKFVTQDFTPFHRDFMRLVSQTIGEKVGTASSGVALAEVEYISQSRLAELKALHPVKFDLQRLVRFCEEIDLSFRNECWFAVAALTRALMDHVPPIFGHGTFKKVANNYAGGGKSFKDSMQHLDSSSRAIADAHLHIQIRKSESLPTRTQVNFENDLDVLLAEIVRILS